MERVIGPSWDVIAVTLLNRHGVPSNSFPNKSVYAYQLVCCELWSRKLLFSVCECGGSWSKNTWLLNVLF